MKSRKVILHLRALYHGTSKVKKNCDLSTGSISVASMWAICRNFTVFSFSPPSELGVLKEIKTRHN